MRHRWRQLVDDLLGHSYRKGVLQEIGSAQELALFIQAHRIKEAPHYDLELDLQPGLEAAEHQMDLKRPTSMRIRYGQHPVGCIEAVEGSERLRGEHLRPTLSQHFTQELMIAVTME